jgi:hypothetical protein
MNLRKRPKRIGTLSGILRKRLEETYVLQGHPKFNTAWKIPKDTIYAKKYNSLPTERPLRKVGTASTNTTAYTVWKETKDNRHGKSLTLQDLAELCAKPLQVPNARLKVKKQKK